MSKTSISAALVGAVLVASACSSTGESPESDPLSMWGWRQDDVWNQLIAAYNATDPAVPVEYQGYLATEYNTVLQTGLSGGDGPDLMMLRSYGGLETLVAGGSVAALDGEVEALEALPSDVLDGARSIQDGHVYGVPFQLVTANILYNVELFSEHGLEEPATWEEFIAICDTLQSAGVTPLAAGVLDSWVLPLYRDLFGAADYDGPDFLERVRSGEADFTDPAYAQANQTLSDLTQYFPQGFEGLSYVDANSIFLSGEAAMYPGGIWELSTFQAEGTVEMGLFNVPRTDGSSDAPYAMGYVDGAFGMNADLDGAAKDGAIAFLEWAGSAEFGSAIANQTLALPAVPGVEPADPLLAKATAAYYENPTPYLTYVGFDYGTPSGTSLEYDNLQRLLLGQITASEVGDNVQAGISQWFTPEQ